MKFTHEFTVPTDVETTWATLTDLERVAPCLPGAKLEEVDGAVHKGRVRVKVGPVTVVYQGTAQMTEADASAKRARIDARGREARGSGTAAADVTASLAEVADGTHVTVVTDLQVTGKPAQFGRGVLQDVGTKIIDQFAQQLEALGDDGAIGEPAPPAGGRPPEGRAGAGTFTSTAAGVSGSPSDSDARRRALEDDDVLDLMSVAGAATLKRLLPIVLGLVVVGALIRRLASR